jgi:hypothetical protein
MRSIPLDPGQRPVLGLGVKALNQLAQRPGHGLRAASPAGNVARCVV